MCCWGNCGPTGGSDSDGPRVQMPGGNPGTWGYFDRPNIQSNMVGFNAKKQGVVMCVGTIDSVNALLAAFSDVALPHHNANPHPTPRTPELETLVREKYALDARLWDLLSSEKVLCW